MHASFWVFVRRGGAAVVIGLFFLPTAGLASLGDAQELFRGTLRSRTEARLGRISEVVAKRSDAIVVRFKGDSDRFRVVSVPAGETVDDLIRSYRSRRDVEYAEPDFIAQALYTPNDTYFNLQWHLDNPANGGVHAKAAWDVSRGAGVTVAVVDTGVAYENFDISYIRAPDLSGTCFVAGYDFINNDSHPNDDNSHGTHVAGTIAQTTNNSAGVAGLAHQSCIMPVKVLDQNGSGSYTAVANGIYFAVDNGAKVVNMSLGGPVAAQVLEDAVRYAYEHGVTVVAAAGNDGTGTANYPAAYDQYVIAVGSVRYDETIAYYSNFGPSVDVVAPGGDLTVDQNGDGYGDGVLQNTFNPNTKNTRDFGYWFLQGTSMAAPHAAAAAALVIAKGAATTPDQVRDALQSTTEDLGAAGRDNTYGWGLINAAAAIAWSGTSTPPPQPPPPAACADGIDNDGDGFIDYPSDPGCADATDNDETDPPPPPPPPAVILYLAPKNGGTIGGISVANEDIVAFDGTNFTLSFDGSDVGVGSFAIDAFTGLADGSLLLSFTGSGSVPGISGTVDDSDLVRFVPTSRGDVTAGAFELYFDGSDVSLTQSSEDIDAGEVLPDGRILLSTSGGMSAGGISAADEDLVAFTPTSLGTNTSGTYAIYFDGSDVGLAESSSEDIDAVAVNSAGVIHLSTVGAFAVSGVSGAGEDVFTFAPTSLGTNTAGNYSPMLFFDGSSFGWSFGTAAIDLP